MTGRVATRASLAWLVASLTACGGRTVELRATGDTGRGPTAARMPSLSAGGAASTDNAARASDAPNVSAQANGGSSAGHEARMETVAAGAMNGAGGTLANDDGGTPRADSGLASAPTLSTPKAQVWVGEIEWAVTYPAYADAPAPQHAVLVLNPVGVGDVGSMVLGNAPPPPPATDANAFYPLVGPHESGNLLAEDLEGRLIEGIAYTLLDVRRTDTRLTFHLNPGELWKDWCKLRTDCSETMGYKIVPDHAPNVDDLCANNPIDLPVCSCDASRCHWNTAIPNVWTMDLELRGGVLEGQVSQSEHAQSGAWSLSIRLKHVE